MYMIMIFAVIGVVTVGVLALYGLFAIIGGDY